MITSADGLRSDPPPSFGVTIFREAGNPEFHKVVATSVKRTADGEALPKQARTEEVI